MYCPLCKAEYRPGFTQCSDCQVPLVDSLEQSDDHLGGDGDSLAEVWRGSTESSQEQVRQILDAANIPSVSGSYEPQLISAQAGEIFWVAVDSSRLDDAKLAFGAGTDGAESFAESPSEQLSRQVSRQNPFNLDNPTWSRRPPTLEGLDEEPTDDVMVTEDQDEPVGLPPEISDEDLPPEDATVSIWSGEDQQTASFLKVCLRENGIPCHVSGSSTKEIFVMPSDAARAKEIAREILNSTPPE